MIKETPGYWIPYVIGGIAMLVVWPFAIGFILVSLLLPLVSNSKAQTALAIIAVVVGVLCMIAAQRYLGYDLHGILAGDE